MYVGDYAPASLVTVKFNTAAFSDGSPITLGGTPAISVYKAGSTTESTAGVTLTVDYDARTGLHNVAIDTSADGTFYAAGNDFDVVITTGTVGGTSVVGRVVGSFSLNNRSALRPTTAGRTLDVSATGEAGVDWANVGSPTTTVGLTNTTISTSQQVASVSGAVGSVTAAVTVGTNNDKTGYGLSAAAVQAIWDALTTALTTIGSIGKLLVTNIDAAISSRSTLTQAQILSDATPFAGADIDATISSRLAAASYTAPDNADIVAIKAKTDNLPESFKKNTAFNNFEFLMVSSTDHVTPKTGLTVGATRSIDGGAFAACANAVVEVGNGIYQINLATTDLNGNFITFRFAATGADDTLISVKTAT